MELDVKVLGPGCVNCDKLDQLAIQALETFSEQYPEASIGYEKITDPARFADFGVLRTPGLVVNGELVSSGRIPSLDQIQGWYQATAPAVE